MDKDTVLSTVKFDELRDDTPKMSENDGFWGNVPEHRDGYILTSRVKGV